MNIGAGVLTLEKKVVQRWTTMDPMAEKLNSYTPYNYCLNNPVNGIDPDGMLSESFIKDLWNKSGEGETKWENKGNNTFAGNNGAVVDAGGGDDKKKTEEKKSELKPKEDAPKSNAGSVMAGTLALTGVLLADDVTVVGVADDAAIPFVLVGGALAASAAYVYDLFSAEHTKGARPSTKGKHEKGQARKGRDRGGEKGDASRRPSNKRPPNWKGKWPPK